MTFPANLQFHRVKAGLNQQQLAKAVGITASQISRYEHGRAHPRVEVVHRIAKALNVPFETLVAVNIPEGPLGHDTGEIPFTVQSLREKFSRPSDTTERAVVVRQNRSPERTKLEIKVVDDGDSTTFKSLESGPVLTQAIQGFLRNYVYELYYDEPDLLEALRTYKVSEVKLTFIGDGGED